MIIIYNNQNCPVCELEDDFINRKKILEEEIVNLKKTIKEVNKTMNDINCKSNPIKTFFYNFWKYLFLNEWKCD
jgi:hypothetical protein